MGIRRKVKDRVALKLPCSMAVFLDSNNRLGDDVRAIAVREMRRQRRHWRSDLDWMVSTTGEATCSLHLIRRNRNVC